MLVVIDNYDSFTYNLAQYLGELGAQMVVFRNDKVGLERVEELAPTHIVISPGPGRPSDGGISNDLILRFHREVPILGVCLGHQCIAYSLGGRVVRAGRLMHGKTSLIHHDGKGVFHGLPNPFPAIRYHSLAVVPQSVPDCLEVTAWTSNGIVMGLRHRRYPVEGVQFHPESIMTEVGKDLLRNFLNRRCKHD